MSSARVVITGLGAISPLGLTVKDTWAGLCAGRSGIGEITAFDPAGFGCKLAGQVPEYNIQQYVPRAYRKAVKLMSRDIELAVIAAHEVLTGSGLVTKGINPDKVNINPERVAINLGAGLISCDLVELAPAVAASVTNGMFDIHKWGKQGLEQITPLWLLKYLPNMPASHLAIYNDFRGPNDSLTLREAAANAAVGEAYQIILRGSAETMLVGATGTRLHPMKMMHAVQQEEVFLNPHGDDPATVSRPFDRNRQGAVLGEGAGAIVLEELASAQARGAT
ncbi:MAG: beta-ketoacyl synthase N-terminal-like domain-containing protein, partial [Planctomycetota bacterium]|nr:beta-ketoacyl synthase N-terminal-like domain-containing protein [Planctomycetota bacterium]